MSRKRQRDRYSYIATIRYALGGLRHILANELNARIHLAVAILVLAAGKLLDLSDQALAAVFFAVLLVFLAEILNSAIEQFLDIVKPEHSEEVKLVKDMAAGAVLVVSVGAFLLGVAIFYPAVVEFLWGR